MKTHKGPQDSIASAGSVRKLAVLPKIIVKNGECVAIPQHNTQPRRRRFAFDLQYRIYRKFDQIPGGAPQGTAGVISKLDRPHGFGQPAVNWLRLIHIRTSSEKVLELILPFISRLSDARWWQPLRRA